MKDTIPVVVYHRLNFSFDRVHLMATSKIRKPWFKREPGQILCMPPNSGHKGTPEPYDGKPTCDRCLTRASKHRLTY